MIIVCEDCGDMFHGTDTAELANHQNECEGE